MAGALVLAVNTITQEKFHAYTDANGDYLVPVPANETAPTLYWIQIQPLDGDVFSFDLNPGNISSYIYSNTFFTEYPVEWFDAEEGPDDDPDKGLEIEVLANQITGGKNLITNRDLIPPMVESAIPAIGSDNVAIRPDIKIKFSEPVDKGSFTVETCYLLKDQEQVKVGGSYTYLKDSTHINKRLQVNFKLFINVNYGEIQT